MFNNNYGQPYLQSMPYMPNYQQQTAPTSNVSWVYVNGIEGARAQIVQPGNTSWMMDNNEPIIYVKTVDGMGTATLKSFRLAEIMPDKPVDSVNADLSAYVQKTDMDGILKRITALEEMFGGINS